MDSHFFNILVFQEIFRDRDLDAKEEKNNSKENEANEDDSGKKDTDVTYEEEHSWQCCKTYECKI